VSVARRLGPEIALRRPARMVGVIPEGRRRVGSVDFDGRRLAWAETDGEPALAKTGRIHVVPVR
jgi:hypothetical protein